MINTPTISVIIPIYNSEKYLNECLDSLINQTFENWEAICIDDCSTDDSLKILSTYAKKDKRIKVFIHKENLGCVKTKNEAVKYSKGVYIYPLDSDDKITPNALEKMYVAVQKKLGDIISCKVRFFGEQSGEFKLSNPTISNFSNRNCIINGSLFRKSDFLKLPSGGYDENLIYGLEDYDLWLNFIFNLHKKIYRVPDVLYYYRIKTKEESRNLSSAEKHTELLKYFLIKYPKMNNYVNQERIISILNVNQNNIISILDDLKNRKTKKTYIKLFNKIPLLKFVYKKNVCRIYLFNFLPVLKFIRKS